MKELSKSISRRLRDPNFIRRYFVGCGVDIGGKPDPLTLYTELFPLIEKVKVWDIEDGDARYMHGVPDNTYDFVHSSHCLEHIDDPSEALKNWLRITKPGGFIVVLIPDEDLYEQGVFPSTFNRDHRKTFTINKYKSWSDRSVNVLKLLSELGPSARVEKVELLAGSYRFNLPRFDQTSTPIGESAIEIIIRKADEEEVIRGGIVRKSQQPEPELRVHYNQYKDDYERMKHSNVDKPPFSNVDPL